MKVAEVKNKMKTLSEGAFTDRVLTQMAGTFTALVKEADFSDAPVAGVGEGDDVNDSDGEGTGTPPLPPPGGGIPAGGDGGSWTSPFASLAYNINIQLPESRDPAVYNAIFKALKEHFR